MNLTAKIFGVLAAAIASVSAEQVLDLDNAQCTAGASADGCQADTDATNSHFEHLQSMFEWHKSVGGKLDKVYMHTVPGENDNNEMRASEAIKMDELVAFIPEEMLLSVAHARENSEMAKILIEKGISDQFQSIGPLVPLVLFFLEDRKNTESKWKDYYATLPRDWSTQLIFFTDEEMKWFEGSDMIEQVEDFKRRLEHDYTLVAENIPDFREMYSLREF